MFKPQLLQSLLARISVKPISAWLFLLALTMCEVLIVYSLAWVGVVCFWILMIYCTIQPIFNNSIKRRDLLLGLSIIPLIRIVSVSFPITKLPQVTWYPLIYFPLLIAAIVVMYVIGLKPHDIGFTRKKIYLYMPVGIGAGLGIGFLEYIVLKPEPLASSFSLQDIWLPALVLMVTTGLVEEIIFRGVLQRLAIPVIGEWGALIYLSIIFAVMHFGFYSSIDVLFVFLVALAFAIAVRKTGSIWGVIIAHGTANIILFTVAPFMLG